MAYQLVVSPTRTANHQTLEDAFIPTAKVGWFIYWTATNKFKVNDVAFFYFGAPVQAIIAVGFVYRNPVTQDGVFAWTDKRRATFCEYQPVRILKKPLSLKEIASVDERLYNWYRGRPYSSSRHVEEDIGMILFAKIIGTNPGFTDIMHYHR